MHDLMLRTRIEALHNHVNRVRELLEAAKERRQAVDACTAGLGQGWQWVLDLKKVLSELKEDFERIELNQDLAELTHGEPVKVPQDIWAMMSSRIDQAEKIAVDTREGIKTVANRVASMKKTVLLQMYDSDIAKTLNAALSKRATEWETSTAELDRTLRTSPLTEAARQAAWKQYCDPVHTDAKDLFAECIEFLGGLALRDTGLDRGICDLADELVQSYTIKRDQQWTHLLTIPSRQEAVSMTLARIIRLGFPEWTIWALPFTAHEFWHAVARKEICAGETFQKGVGEVKLGPATQECLADAFATFAMGPAFAYAAILLRLEPFQAFTESPGHAADDDRARAIFKMLEIMGRDSPGSSYDDEVRKPLEAEWDGAVQHAGPVGKADPKRREHIEGLVELLHQSLDMGGFTTAAWESIRAWPEKLASGELDEIQRPLVPELRQVLNAAWLARTSIEHRTDQIAQHARELWEKFKREPQGRRDSRPMVRMQSVGR